MAFLLYHSSVEFDCDVIIALFIGDKHTENRQMDGNNCCVRMWFLRTCEVGPVKSHKSYSPQFQG